MMVPLGLGKRPFDGCTKPGEVYAATKDAAMNRAELPVRSLRFGSSLLSSITPVSESVLRWLPGTFVLIMVLVTTSCLSSPKSRGCDLRTVLAYREPGMIAGEARMFWLYERADGRVMEFYRHLGDFEPQWGIGYEIQVEKFSFNTLLGPGHRNEVEILNATERPGLEFRMHSFGKAWLGADGRSFVDGQAFICASEQVCASIDDMLRNELARVDLVCRLPAEPGGPVVVVAVEPPSCKSRQDCEWPQVCCMNLGPESGTERGTCRGTRNPPVNADWPPRASSAACSDCHDASVRERVPRPPHMNTRPCE